MTQVSLWEKPLKDGCKMIYLTFWPEIPDPDTGKLTRRKSLKLTVYAKPKNQSERDYNKEQRTIAEHVRAQQQLNFNRGEYGFLHKSKQEACFIQYFTELVNKRTGSNGSNWESALQHLKEYAGHTIKMKHITANWCDGFADYLLNADNRHATEKTLNRNTAVSYFAKFKAALKQAYKDEFLAKDINAKVEALTPEETHREYLNLEELRTLAQTACEDENVKRAALFTALTGMRHCDVMKLLWGQIRYSDANGYSIQFRQQKTQGAENLPISQDAYDLLGTPGSPQSKIFPDLYPHASYRNRIIKNWVAAAGITKHITHHCFRHTFATIQLTLGEDIYTVKEMLGQKNIKHTQIYAKIVDDKKRKAADRIKL
ncbi:site-specific integrase [Tellurirhabdus rosea]|uniref:site-specific integrase n=1 Tax=Tellurirhabdus rosea TaxID=2674997 RepID=UPI00225C19F9|nr:site-specific integrase [Tellurirhabdus rosea]